MALGPLVGGAVTSGWSWQYIFWLNVPVGLVLIPLAWWKLSESRGTRAPSRPGRRRAGQRRPVRGGPRPGRGQRHGWTSSARCSPRSPSGRLALVGLRAPGSCGPTTPCSTSACSRDRGFASVNVTALLFSFGMFGSIFFLVQFLQTVQGCSPLAAGVRILPWTAMPMLLAPVVGQLAERWGGKPLVVTGLSLQAVGLAWLASVTTPDHPVRRPGGPFVVCGVGMTLFFVPLASLVLGAVPRRARGRGLRGQRRLPRARRGAGHRRARGRLQLPRRLRLGPGLRRRDDRRPCTPGRPWWPSAPSPPCSSRPTSASRLDWSVHRASPTWTGTPIARRLPGRRPPGPVRVRCRIGRDAADPCRCQRRRLSQG